MMPSSIRCHYLKGGRCKEQGEGDRKHWKPLMTSYTGPDGEEKRKMTKKLCYVCDLNLNGKKKMKQTRLSFSQPPGKITRKEDTKQNILGLSFMSTVGKSTSSSSGEDSKS